MDPLEQARLAALTQIVRELIGVVARLNVETYQEASGGPSAFPREPPKPRVAGYVELQEILERLRAALDSEP